jgi:hypothetical protein
VFFVAPTGRDANPGTAARPFATFTKSLMVLRPGDTLYARGGTYRERVRATHIVPGEPGARILVTNLPGQRPVIQGELWVAYPSYWTFSGINVTWGPSNPDEHMVNIYGGTGWVLENSEIWGAHSYADLLIGDGRRNNLGSFVVRDNCIHDTYPTNGVNEDHNIYVDDTVHSPNVHGTIERNLIFDAPNGRGIKLGPPGTSGGATHITVRYNTIWGAYQDVSLSRDASHNRIYGNILANAADANIGTWMLKGTDNLAFGNLMYASMRPADTGVTMGPGNRRGINPKFDALTCQGFHPRNPVAQVFGRFG